MFYGADTLAAMVGLAASSAATDFSSAALLNGGCSLKYGISATAPASANTNPNYLTTILTLGAGSASIV